MKTFVKLCQVEPENSHMITSKIRKTVFFFCKQDILYMMILKLAQKIVDPDDVFCFGY